MPQASTKSTLILANRSHGNDISYKSARVPSLKETSDALNALELAIIYESNTFTYNKLSVLRDCDIPVLCG